MTDPQQKVVAYITRDTDADTLLLVFDHRDFPAAGTQVPAGTVEPAEDLEHALFREIAEESGLTGLRLVRKLGQTNEWRCNVHRHFYHLAAPPDLPDAWDWTTNDYHDDAHRARHEPLVYRYRWVLLTDDLKLAGNQHRLIPLIKHEAL